MDISYAEKIVTSQVVWALLCILVVYAAYKAVIQYIKDLREENRTREEQLVDLYEKQKLESTHREERLMTHIEKTTDTLEKIDTNVEELQKGIVHVNTRVDDILKKIQGRRITDEKSY